jgi:hypothetical protein
MRARERSSSPNEASAAYTRNLASMVARRRTRDEAEPKRLRG